MIGRPSYDIELGSLSISNERKVATGRVDGFSTRPQVAVGLCQYYYVFSEYLIQLAHAMGTKNAISILCYRGHQSLRTRIPQIDLAAVRAFHESGNLRENRTPQYQPRDLGDFYNDLLTTPLPKVAKATTETELPEWVASGGRKDIEERAKKVFGSIEGSGYQSSVSQTPDSTWKTINGVPIPPRPSEPDNCCMSGCVQ